MCLLLASPMKALDPARRADSYSIQGWSTENGLPSNKIRAVTQTRDGYRWLATAQGIARFDGSGFTVFTSPTNPDARGGGFWAVKEAPDGSLWFGGENGLFRWRNGSFEQFTTAQGLANNNVRALTVTVAVIDNGVGIARENLTRIFAHGFTTRQHGHGFGLHSGALAARELGGALTAHSDGPGLGARFVLELPYKLDGTAHESLRP